MARTEWTVVPHRPVRGVVHKGSNKNQTNTAEESIKIDNILNNETAECQVPTPSRGIHDTIVPLWVASFPGSGSELFRSLVESITGLETDEVYNKATDCNNHPVICKTHWPLKIGGSASKWGLPPPDRKDHFAPQVILLIRNPAKALPSLFNYKWEEKHKVPNHSLQGSEAEWKEWRDRRFEQDLQAWKRLLLKWTTQGPNQQQGTTATEQHNNDNNKVIHRDGDDDDEEEEEEDHNNNNNNNFYRVTLFVPYEEIIQQETGPALLEKVAEQLQLVRTPTAPRQDLFCHWHRAVHQQPSKKRTGHSYEPSYTRKQQERMLQVLQEVKNELLVYYQEEMNALRILDKYRREIKYDMRIDAPDDVIVSTTRVVF